MQIIVQVAIKAARPTMDASTPEPLKRLIAKCWAQVCLLLVQSSLHLPNFQSTPVRLARGPLRMLSLLGQLWQGGHGCCRIPGCAPAAMRSCA